jgi:hypothetical protein
VLLPIKTDYMANNNLANAKNAKNDEFYTQYHDIEVEVNAYLEYDKDVFRGKTVLLPCDDPEWSNFTKFFAQKFQTLGLKKLISTSYAPESKKYKYGYQPSLFEAEDPKYDAAKTQTHGKIFVLERDKTGDGRIDYQDIEWTYLDGDGDFRSKEVCKLRDEADIIVTNPPFSLFREFYDWVIKANKKFLVVCNKNCITYKEVFPDVRDNKVWSGKTEWAGGMWFETKNEDDVDKVINGVCMKNTPSIWITNLEHGRRHQPLPLMTRTENLKFSKHKELKGREDYIHYTNYDAIEVPYTDAIPSDFDGTMGVPISFLDKYCPEQFVIIGQTQGDSGKELGLKPFDRELKKLNPSLRDGQLYYMENGIPQKPYARILIRKKQ